VRYEIEFFGHENIRSNHKKTIEITKESHLTPRGDCIVVLMLILLVLIYLKN